MAELCIKRLLPAELIPHPPTMTARLIERVKTLILLVHFVRNSEFPLVELAFHVFGVMAGGFGL